MRFCLVSLAVFTSILFTTTVHADTKFNGGGDGLRWDDDANWSSGVPDDTQRAFIVGSSTVLLDGAAGSAATSRLILADDAESDDVTLNINGGSLHVGGTAEISTVGKATVNITNGSNVTVDSHVRFATDPTTSARRDDRQRQHAQRRRVHLHAIR